MGQILVQNHGFPISNLLPFLARVDAFFRKVWVRLLFDFNSISQATRALTSWVVFLYLGALYRTPLAKKLWNWPIQEPVPVTFHEFCKFQTVVFRKFSGVIMKLVQSDLKPLGVQNQELPHPQLWIQVINFQIVSFFTISSKTFFTLLTCS